MKKIILTIMVSITLATITLEGRQLLKKPVPIVYRIDSQPGMPFRKKPLKQHFMADYSLN